MSKRKMSNYNCVAAASSFFIGKVVLATLLINLTLRNSFTSDLVVRAQVQGGGYLRGAGPGVYTNGGSESVNNNIVPANVSPFAPRPLPSDEELEENPHHLKLVEGEEDDEGTIVMAHSANGLPVMSLSQPHSQLQETMTQQTQTETQSQTNQDSEFERIRGFIEQLPPIGDEDGHEENDRQSIYPHPPAPQQQLDTQNHKGASPPLSLAQMQTEQQTMGTPSLPSSEQQQVQQQRNFFDVDKVMGPIPNQEFHSQYGFNERQQPSQQQQQTSQPMNNVGGMSASPPQETQTLSTQDNSVPAVSKETCPNIPPRTRFIRKPTMVASYPGSGAKLTWKLIRAVTGYMTSDDAVDLNDLAKNKQVVAIKTHYPARGSSDDYFAPFANVEASILLIRNPLSCIPSFLSFLYEQSQNLTGHSVRAPLDVWISWRDRHFENELELWVNHARYWMKHHTQEKRMVLPYEYLIKPGSGPTELRKVRTFIEKHGQIKLRTPIEKVGCIWDYIVMKREGQGTVSGSMRQGGPAHYPYTPSQYNIMKNALDGLKKEFPGELGTLMELYTYQINEAQIALGF